MDLRSRITTLTNGLQVITVQRPSATTAMLCVDVHVGSRYESAQDAGLSHLLEHMLFQGSDQHGAPVAINRLAESLGAALNGCTSRDSTRIEHWVSAPHLAASAQLVAGLIVAPRFDDLETEREIVIEEALEEFDETGRRTDPDTLSRRAAWPESPLGTPIVGELDCLGRFDVEDLRRHHAKHYCARNMLLTVVGPHTPEALFEAVEGPFSALPAGSPVTPLTATPVEGPVVVRVSDTGSQCECRLTFHTPGRALPMGHALSIARLVLDDGMASRLHQRLGAELGLAYDQWAMWEAYPDAGLFEFGALVSPEKVETFFTEAHELALDLIRKPLQGEELDRLRFRTRWAFESAMETPDGLVNAFALPRFYGEAEQSPGALLTALLAVTPEEISTAAAACFQPSKAVLTCVGPMSKGTRRALRAIPRRWS